MEKCAYCGKPSKYQLKNKKFCCEERFNKCPAIRNKNSHGLKMAHKNGKMSYDHFIGKREWNKNKTSFTDHRLSSHKKGMEIFSENSTTTTHQIKKIIIVEKLIPYQCHICKNDDIWMNKKITLELDHINGNRTDNRLCNLRFLCPNCHSQTPTFRSRNTNNKSSVSDDELLKALNTYPSINKALRSLGLAGASNYKRVYALKLKILQNQFP